LWAISQGDPAPVRLTSGDFDDREPAVSPDGRWVAFASDRNGGWDLYLLDLTAGEVRQLTQTASFEGQPTWSPDGVWLAYEYYAGEDLDTAFLPVDGRKILSSHRCPVDGPVAQLGSRRQQDRLHLDRDGLPDVFRQPARS
jgi:Tol biopolymer transport system component